MEEESSGEHMVKMAKQEYQLVADEGELLMMWQVLQSEHEEKEHWQYDRKTLHDGYRNAYILTKNKKNIMLLPWRSHENQTTIDTILLQNKKDIRVEPHSIILSCYKTRRHQ